MSDDLRKYGAKRGRRQTVRPDDEDDPDLDTHTLTVEYVYEQQKGRWNLISIDYLCFECFNQTGVEHPYLHEIPDQQLAAARLYLLGQLLTIPCE